MTGLLIPPTKDTHMPSAWCVDWFLLLGPLVPLLSIPVLLLLHSYCSLSVSLHFFLCPPLLVSFSPSRLCSTCARYHPDLIAVPTLQLHLSAFVYLSFPLSSSCYFLHL